MSNADGDDLYFDIVWKEQVPAIAVKEESDFTGLFNAELREQLIDFFKTHRQSDVMLDLSRLDFLKGKAMSEAIGKLRSHDLLPMPISYDKKHRHRLMSLFPSLCDRIESGSNSGCLAKA